jgi:cell filamentation protein
MSEHRRYRAINFDLSTERLIETFGETSYRKAYSEIKTYLTSKGFEHRQWSGYRSRTALSNPETADLILDLAIDIPWLAYCANRIDITEIGKSFDALQIINKRIRT